MTKWSEVQRIPQEVKLYWQCLVCKELFPWPERKASKYCSAKCRQKAYRFRGI